MSKLILEFSIPEETDDAQLAQEGWKWKAVVEELYGYIRSQIKYTENESITFEELRAKLSELIRDENLKL